MGFLGYRGAAIPHNYYVVSAVRRLPGGAFHYKVGRYARQQQCINASSGKYCGKIRAIEGADPTLGHHRLSIMGGDRFVDLRTPCTLHKSIGPDKAPK